MTFRDQMKVGHSRAEHDVFDLLQKEGLTTFLRTGQAARILLHHERDGISQTEPDWLWTLPNGFKYAVYLDGPSHLKRHREHRDTLIDVALTKMGFKVSRFPYNGRSTKKRTNEVVAEVKAVLERNGYWSIIK